MHNPTCFANHMGWWAIDSQFIRGAVAAVAAGKLVARDPEHLHMAVDFSSALRGEVVSTNANGKYMRYDNGMATVRIDGPMMKGSSKYGGTSTIATRVALRAAIDDQKVNAIMVVVDSPGGTVAGTQELADAITAAAGSKPLAVYVDDLSASAAVWATAGASEITAGRSARIGSVGVINVLEDTSKEAEANGVEVIVFATGGYKGVGVDGASVTDEHRTYMQSLVDDMGAMFFDAVAAGRNISAEAMNEIKSAKIFNAQKALELGLIDRIGTFEDAAASLMSKVKGNRRARAASARAAFDLDL